MKIRLTIMTENDKTRPPELTEEKVKAAWQVVLDAMCLMSDDKCIVEKAEFVEKNCTESVFDRLVKILDTNCGYVDEEKAETVAKRLMGSGLIVKEKHGEWQITDAYPNNVYCSECHKKFAQTHWVVWEDGSLPRNFCPNCGADMRGDDDV